PDLHAGRGGALARMAGDAPERGRNAARPVLDRLEGLLHQRRLRGRERGTADLRRQRAVARVPDREASARRARLDDRGRLQRGAEPDRRGPAVIAIDTAARERTVMRQRSEMILADLVALRAEVNPDLDVLTFEHLSLGDGRPDEVLTYAALQQGANRIAHALVARGLDRGDRFGLMMRNHPEFVMALVAASITGCVAVPIDPRTRGEKLAFTLRDAGCRALVLSDDVVGEATRAAGSDGDERGRLPAEPLADVLARPAPTVDVRLASGRDPLQIIYTSGTTGDPKGVVFPNERFGLFALLGGLLGYRPDDRPYTGLSLTHGNA